jgi:hypothetical protein
MAPGASIVLAETPGTTRQNIARGGGYPQLMAAENYLINHNVGDVISQSFSLPEQNAAAPGPSRAARPRARRGGPGRSPRSPGRRPSSGRHGG